MGWGKPPPPPTSVRFVPRAAAVGAPGAAPASGGGPPWHRIRIKLAGSTSGVAPEIAALPPGTLLWAKEASFPWWPARLVAHPSFGFVRVVWLGWDAKPTSRLPAGDVILFAERREEWSKHPSKSRTGGGKNTKSVPAKWKAAVAQATALEEEAAARGLAVDEVEFSASDYPSGDEGEPDESDDGAGDVPERRDTEAPDRDAQHEDRNDGGEGELGRPQGQAPEPDQHGLDRHHAEAEQERGHQRQGGAEGLDAVGAWARDTKRADEELRGVPHQR